jgi:hypothetical protein
MKIRMSRGDVSREERPRGHTVEDITLFLLFVHLFLPSLILLNTPFPILLPLHIDPIFLSFGL